MDFYPSENVANCRTLIVGDGDGNIPFTGSGNLFKDS